MTAAPIVLVDGREPEVADLVPFALVNDGHFSTMQVRDGGVRGLCLHVDRLIEAHRDLYETTLDPRRILAAMDAATAAHPDCSLRVTIAEPVAGEPCILTAVRPPRSPDPRPARLHSVAWTRAVPTIKHVGMFPQIQAARFAESEGFDDAVLTDLDGNVVETTIANLAFVSGRDVVWADGPSLLGTTWQLLEHALPAAGFTTRRAMVHARELGQCTAAVTANSSGVAPIGSIDDQDFADSVEAAEQLDALFQAVPLDSIADAH